LSDVGWAKSAMVVMRGAAGAAMIGGFADLQC